MTNSIILTNTDFRKGMNAILFILFWCHIFIFYLHTLWVQRTVCSSQMDNLIMVNVLLTNIFILLIC